MPPPTGIAFADLIRYNVQKKAFFTMNILMLPFEESLTISVNGEKVSLVAFRTLEHGNIKFGVEAPRTVKVHREEIYQAILQKQADAESRDGEA